VIEYDHRDELELQGERGEKTCVAGENACGGIDQDRVCKAELLNTRRYLVNLTLAVSAGVAGVWYKTIGGPELDRR